MTISLLTACETASFDTQPDVIEYSAVTQNKVANELMSCPVPTITELLKDYKVMRDQARVSQ